jgi:hypothetical protein
MAKAGRPMGKLHQDDVRKKIQAGRLIEILHKCAEGGEEIAHSRMKAIEILLRKSLPDLSAVEISGSEDNPLTMLTKVEFAVVKPTN